MKIVTKALIITILIISNSAYSDEGKVCFYELADFNGESFCSAENESLSIYDNEFNSKIESISVPPGMVVTLYDETDFSGKELLLKNDIDLQGLKLSGFYNKINSYKIAPAICLFFNLASFQYLSNTSASFIVWLFIMMHCWSH